VARSVLGAICGFGAITTHTSPTPRLIVGAGRRAWLAAALSDVGLSALLIEQQPRGRLDKPADDGREIA